MDKSMDRDRCTVRYGGAKKYWGGGTIRNKGHGHKWRATGRNQRAQSELSEIVDMMRDHRSEIEDMVRYGEAWYEMKKPIQTRLEMEGPGQNCVALRETVGAF